MEIIQLIEKIIDSDNWPYFSDADRLDELDELAEEAFRRKTFDGFLSYVFITHQICDELLKLLIVHTRFTLQLYLIPDGFNYKFSDKSWHDPFKLDRFGCEYFLTEEATHEAQGKHSASPLKTIYALIMEKDPIVVWAIEHPMNLRKT